MLVLVEVEVVMVVVNGGGSTSFGALREGGWGGILMKLHG